LYSHLFCCDSPALLSRFFKTELSAAADLQLQDRRRKRACKKRSSPASRPRCLAIIGSRDVATVVGCEKHHGLLRSRRVCRAYRGEPRWGLPSGALLRLQPRLAFSPGVSIGE